jgi:hypothetical protein
MSAASERSGSQTGRADSSQRRNRMTDVLDGGGVQRTAVRAKSLTGVGVCGPGLGGGGEGERAAVEDVFAALSGDQGAE